jgi:hypothetical protein
MDQTIAKTIKAKTGRVKKRIPVVLFPDAMKERYIKASALADFIADENNEKSRPISRSYSSALRVRELPSG